MDRQREEESEHQVHPVTNTRQHNDAQENGTRSSPFLPRHLLQSPSAVIVGQILWLPLDCTITLLRHCNKFHMCGPGRYGVPYRTGNCTYCVHIAKVALLEKNLRAFSVKKRITQRYRKKKLHAPPIFFSGPIFLQLHDLPQEKFYCLRQGTSKRGEGQPLLSC